MGFRILHVISSVNPINGGPIEGLLQLADVNQRAGHSVEVLSLDDPDSPWVKSCKIKCYPMGPSKLKYGYTPRLVPWLRANRSNFDVVIVNGIWGFGSFGTWLALHDSATPYFVFTHGMLDPWFKKTYPLKHFKKWLYWPWAEYRVLRDASAVMFTCEEERRLARRSFWLYRCDEFVVNYGTAGAVGDAGLQRSEFLSQFPHLQGKRCLLFLGRVHVKKGLDLTLNAFAELLRRLPEGKTGNLHLIVAGPSNDAYGEKMKSLAKALGLSERVTWTGMLTGDRKWGAFHSADAFVLSSHQENFGIAVAEALSCSLPVLISNKVNIWREIRQVEAGFVDNDDLPGTFRVMEQWVEAELQTRQTMRTAARKCFDERFFIDRAGESFVRAMELYGLRRRLSPPNAIDMAAQSPSNEELPTD